MLLHSKSPALQAAVLVVALLALRQRRRRKQKAVPAPNVDLCSTVDGLKVEWPKETSDAVASRESSNVAVARGVQLIHEQGLCWIPDILPPHLLDEAFKCAQNNFQACLGKIEDHGYQLGIGIANGFEEIVQRHEGRFDMQFMMKSSPFTDKSITRNPRLMPILRGVLGVNCELAHISLVISKPNCGDQRWHIDGEHLYRGHYLPAHALNVFIPLTALTTELGPTEFCTGSHKLTNTKLSRATMDSMIKCPKVQVTCAAGDAIIFDYRVLHRGRANVDAIRNRPLLCLVFTRKWFVDALNYPPYCIDKIQDRKDAQVNKLRLIYPKLQTSTILEVMESVQWDWHKALAIIKAGQKNHKQKQKAEAK